ncbi:helix-turn-helix domain-containing protein [Sporosarcina newyorkensis]|uniref:Helix-turn-helix domain-containing protein n=1 Tax=Sporosarcina newyorkensis TaxID=759851 RepID=A0A1T4XGT9_9BACL|nr:helix-turn-helix transcriptional regulator [Sporosarcina newyorkensis]SKA88699.1 Helix-turn-helix domain-containing protein [Sporosarcina newyorkensis]
MLNADNLATVRTFHGLTQRKLAALLDVSQPYIAQVEAGARPLTDSLRNKIAATLDLTADKMAQIMAIDSQRQTLLRAYSSADLR